MKNFVEAIACVVAVASCAAFAESPDALASAPVMATPKASALTAVPEDTPVAFKEISGVWISVTSGNTADFSIKNIKIFDGSVAADVHISSSFAQRCDVSERVVGVYAKNILQFNVVTTDCNKRPYHRMISINTVTWKGEFFDGRGKMLGWYVVKNNPRIERM